MKKFYSFLLVAFVAMTTDASAQFVQSTATTKSNTTTMTSTQGDYSGSRYYVGYNPVTIEWSEDQSEMEDEVPLNKGITVGYAKRSKLDSSSLPLYYEYGCNIGYMFGSYSDEFDDGDYCEKYNLSINLISANVPINVTMPIQVDNFTLMPYCGVNLRLNLLGNVDYRYEFEDRYYGESETDTETINLFDNEDLDTPFNRFQAGLNFGVNIEFDKFNVGVGYVKDLSKLWEPDDDYYGKLGVATISVGYKF